MTEQRLATWFLVLSLLACFVVVAWGLGVWWIFERTLGTWFDWIGR